MTEGEKLYGRADPSSGRVGMIDRIKGEQTTNDKRYHNHLCDGKSSTVRTNS